MTNNQRATTDDVAWIEALGREHARLGKLLTRLNNTLIDPEEEATRQLPALLEEVLLHCRQHMTYEEQEGYLSGVLDRLPNAAERLESLRGEHVTLQEEIAQCTAAAKAVADQPDELIRLMPRVRQWLADIREHELRENSLVQEVFNRDIGAGD